MKRVLLDGNLILRGFNEEGAFQQEFAALWEILQSSTTQGYITSADLALLSCQLTQEIGCQADVLITAVQRILQVWSANQGYPIDVIVSDAPDRFMQWGVPVLSVSEFLQRYELDQLLAVTCLPDEPVPLTEIVQQTLPQQPRFSRTALLSTLLLLPVLFQMWMRREHLLHELTVAFGLDDANPISSNSATNPLRLNPIADGLEMATSIEPIQSTTAPVELVTNSSLSDLRFPPAHLSLASIPGIEIDLEDDIAFDIRLERPTNTVAIHLAIPPTTALSSESRSVPTLNKQVLATIYCSDSNEAIAQIVQTGSKILITAAVATGDSGNTPSTVNRLGAGQLARATVAVVYSTPGDHAIAGVSIRTASAPLPQVEQRDRPEQPISSLITVRQVNGLELGPVLPSTSIGAVIRFSANTNGSYDLGIGILSAPSEATPVDKNAPEFRHAIVAEHPTDHTPVPEGSEVVFDEPVANSQGIAPLDLVISDRTEHEPLTTSPAPLLPFSYFKPRLNAQVVDGYDSLLGVARDSWLTADGGVADGVVVGDRDFFSNGRSLLSPIGSHLFPAVTPNSLLTHFTFNFSSGEAIALSSHEYRLSLLPPASLPGNPLLSPVVHIIS